MDTSNSHLHYGMRNLGKSSTLTALEHGLLETTNKVFKKDINFLIMIDACTGWVEFAPMLNKRAIHTAKLFLKHWLCWYPPSCTEIFDDGTEFIGDHFQEMLASYNIQPHPTMMKNPQANVIVECNHSHLLDQLCCTIFKETDWISDLDTIIQASTFAFWATVPFNTPYLPAQMAFGVDMFFPQKTIIDGEKLKQLRQQQTESNNSHENKKGHNTLTMLGIRFLSSLQWRNAELIPKSPLQQRDPILSLKCIKTEQSKSYTTISKKLSQTCPSILQKQTVTQQHASIQKIFLHKIMRKYIISIPLV